MMSTIQDKDEEEDTTEDQPIEAVGIVLATFNHMLLPPAINNDQNRGDELTLRTLRDNCSLVYHVAHIDIFLLIVPIAGKILAKPRAMNHLNFVYSLAHQSKRLNN